MELVALWFENYKIFGKTTLPLSPKYQCNFDIDDEDNLAIDIQKSSYYNIFPDNLNIITIVGKNGMGKTTILNIIRSILNSNDKNDTPKKYCMIFYNGNEFIYKKSKNIKIKINCKPSSSREWDYTFKDGYHVETCKCLTFKPYMEQDFPLEHSMFYNSYDNELKIQDQINNYFVYDRLDENVVAFSIGRTINNFKKIDFFKETKNINFDEFGWEFNIKDCYEHIVNRLRKQLRDGINNKFPMTFPIVLFNNNKLIEYYELINKIAPFKDDKYDWDNGKIDISQVLKDIIFFAGICEFGFYLSKIEDKRNISINNLSFNENIPKIENILDAVLKEQERLKTPTDFLNTLISTLGGKNRWALFKSYNSFNENPFLKNIIQLKDTLSNHCSIQLLEDYFDRDKWIFKLKPDYRLGLNQFINTDNYNEQIDNFSAIYLHKYKGITENDAIETICELFPDDFIQKYFNINLYKKKPEHSITFKDLSTGEQRILKFFADILYCNPRDVYLLDEMDISWHPEWQRELINLLIKIMKLDKFKNNKINIIITTHSPIILSDMPKENVIQLEYDKNTNKTIVSESSIGTFGANIHTILAKPIFMDSTIGSFAQKQIQNIAKILSSNDKKDDYEYVRKFIKLLDDENIYKKILKAQLEIKEWGIYNDKNCEL